MTLIDSHEDGDLSEYTGDLTYFDTFQHSDPIDGSNVLRESSNDAGRKIISTSGLPTYPEAGKAHSVYVKFPDSGGASYTLFGVQDSTSYYSVLAWKGSDALEIRKDSAGTVLNSTAATWSTGTWYEITIDWDTDGTITVEQRDMNGTVLATVSATDTSYSSGGFGFEQGSSSNAAYWDYAQIITPQAPGSVSLTIDGDDQLTGSWDSVPKADSYRVQASADGGTWTTEATPSGTSATFAVSTAPDEWQIRARAENSYGVSDWVTSTVKSTNVDDLAASSGTVGEVDLSWTPVDDEQGYDILRAEATGTTRADYSVVDSVAAGASSYTDTGREDGERYFYRVDVTYSGTDSLSNEADATASLPAPAIDALDASTEDELGVDYSVSDNSQDGTVEIYASTDGSLGSLQETRAVGDPTSTTLTGLPDGTTHFVTVRRVTDHTSTDSTQASATTALPAPTTVAAPATTATSIDVTWTATHDTGETEVQYKRSSDTSWTTFSTVARTTEQETITGLLNGEGYETRAVAVTADATSASGDVASVFTDGAEDGDTSEWTLSADADGTNYHFTATSADAFAGSFAFEQYLEGALGSATRQETQTVGTAVTDPVLSFAFKQYHAVDGNPDFESRASLLVDVTLMDASSETLTYQFGTVSQDDAGETDASSLFFVLDSLGSTTWTVADRTLNDDLAAGGFADVDTVDALSLELTTPGTGGGVDEIGVRVDALDLRETAGVATATTALPDEDQPTPLNGVEDEITLDRESTTTNYGDIRIQQRETGESAWDASAIGWAEQVITFDTLTTTFTGLEDGEEMEYRARTETEHVQGTWTTPVAITTKFPGATDLLVTGTTSTSVSLSWTDNADNEDGQEIIRERRVDGAWWPEEVVDDAGPSATTYTDDTVQPDTEYRYRVRPFTEHSSAESNTVTVTTDSEGVSRTTAPAEDWYVEVDHPNRSAPLTPTVLEGAEFPHQVNTLPEISVPIRKSERWLDDQQLEEAPMRVWKDGKRLPIELLDNVRERPDRVILEGSGGQALTQRVQAEFVEEPAHTGAGIVIDQTGLAHNIDDPQTTTTDDRMQSADTRTEWLDRLAETANPDDVYMVENGELKTRQTAYFVEAENADTTLITTTASGRDDFSGGVGENMTDGFINDNAEIGQTFSLTHTIPAGDGRVDFRFFCNNGSHAPFSVHVDGEEIVSFPADFFNASSGTSWELGRTVSHELSGDVTVTILGEGNSSSSTPSIVFDCLSLWDDRYPPGFTENVTNGVLEGPDLRPSGIEVETEDAITFLSVVAGELTSSWNDLSGDQAVAISNDLGQTWHEATNSDSVEAEFADESAQIRARFRLSGFDSDPSTSPAGRKEAHAVNLYDLYSDLNDQPLILGKNFSGKGVEVLHDIAGDHSFFAIEWDDDLDEQVVQWTQPGLRTRDADVDLVDYETAKVHEDSYDRVVIRGQAKSVEGELVYPNDSEPLDHAPVVEGTGRVYDPATGTVYQEDADYELNRLEGEITILSIGDMVSGEEYQIDYEWKVSGSYEAPDAGEDAKTFEREIPSIPTSRGAQQAALYLFRKVDEPLIEAEATLSNVDPRQSIVETIGIEGLPTAGQRVEVRESKSSDRKPKLRLGNRRSAQEEFDDIRSQLQAVSRLV